jgi:hypothetical protein
MTSGAGAVWCWLRGFDQWSSWVGCLETNDEGDDGGAVITVTFEEQGGKRLLVVHDLYPSKEALGGAIASLGASVGRSQGAPC